MAKIFRNGKYRGRSLEYVRVVNPQYYRWAISSAPNLIVDDSVPLVEKWNLKPLTPNLNFDNEGPEFNN